MKRRNELHFDYDMNQPFTLLYAGPAFGKRIIERTDFEYYVFAYILEGAGTVSIDNAIKFTAQANDVYILPKYRDHKLHPFQKKGWSKLFFIADGPVIEHLLTAYNLDKVFLYRNCNLLQEAFLNMRKTFLSSVDNFQLNLDAAVILYKIVQSLYLSVNPAAPQYAIDVFNIKKILDANINNKVTLDTICRQLQKSKAYVIRKFKMETGQTPYNYLLNKRLELACRLLRATNFSIKEIAERLNFADQYYFSDLFKKKTGLSPKYYRAKSFSRLP